MEKKLTKISMIVLFILSALSFLYFVYMISVSGSYITTMINAKEVSMENNFGQIIQYFMKNTSSYLFYSVSLGFMGIILFIKSKEQQENKATSNT